MATGEALSKRLRPRGESRTVSMWDTASSQERLGSAPKRSRWDIIGYAIESTARTLRLCLIVAVMAAPAVLLLLMGGR